MLQAKSYFPPIDTKPVPIVSVVTLITKREADLAMVCRFWGMCVRRRAACNPRYAAVDFPGLLYHGKFICMLFFVYT